MDTLFIHSWTLNLTFIEDYNGGENVSYENEGVLEDEVLVSMDYSSRSNEKIDSENK